MPDEAGAPPCAAACGCGAKAFGAGDCGCGAKAFGAGDCGCGAKAFGAGASAGAAASFMAETNGEPKGMAGAVAVSEGVDALCCDVGVNSADMDA